MKIAILGAGHIGAALYSMLLQHTNHDVIIYDLNGVDINSSESPIQFLDVRNSDEIRDIVKTNDIIVSALPFRLNIPIARTVAEMGKIYIDFTEDVETGQAIIDYNKKLAAPGTMIPHMGLAPGMVSTVAMAMVNAFDKVHSVDIKVGALGLFDDHPSHYYRTWSSEGVINEYKKPCPELVSGFIFAADPLYGYETVRYHGLGEFEAFYTSGGAGTLFGTLLLENSKFDKVHGRATYKSLRYKGHRDWVLKNLFPKTVSGQPAHDDATRLEIFNRIPVTGDDRVIIAINVTGEKQGKLISIPCLETISPSGGYTAIEVATAMPVLRLIVWLSNKIFDGEKLPPTILAEDLDLEELADLLLDK